MALSKIQAESMNLADTFAFTGTVSGTPDTNDMTLLLNATISSSIGEYDISSTYINSTYDTYFLDASFHIESDSKLLYLNPFVNGSIASSGIAYNVLNIDSGQRVFTDSSTVIRAVYNPVGNQNGESATINGYLQNVNSTTIPFVFSGKSNYYRTNGVHESALFTGGFVVGNRALVVNGFRLWFSGSQIQEGTVKLYGLRK
tara:strand:+ start:654 stop:1256 length:603 start_codon:yes stop_codon:yes gene_type:complete